MSTRLYLSILIYMLVQGVLFGIGTVFILATPLNEQAQTLMPIMIVITFILAVPLSWLIAPRMMLRFSKKPRMNKSSAIPPHHGMPLFK